MKIIPSSSKCEIFRINGGNRGFLALQVFVNE
jgi:hypothetical protein